MGNWPFIDPTCLLILSLSVWFPPYFSLQLHLAPPPPSPTVYQEAVAALGWLLGIDEEGGGTLSTVTVETHSGLAILGKLKRGTCQTLDFVEKDGNGEPHPVAYHDLAVCLEVLCAKNSVRGWEDGSVGKASAIHATGWRKWHQKVVLWLPHARHGTHHPHYRPPSMYQALHWVLSRIISTHHHRC